MGGREEWETTGFVFSLSNEGDVLRARIRVAAGKVIRFTVQYETEVDGEPSPVVRYDSAHGMAHRDLLDDRGRVVEKRWFPGKEYGQVVTNAIADIKANWQTYLAGYPRRTP